MFRKLSLLFCVAFCCFGIAACSKSESRTRSSSAKKTKSSESGQNQSTSREDGPSVPAMQASHNAEPGRLPGMPLNSQNGGVAVIDLNRIAIRLDRLSGFKAQLETSKTELEANIKLLDDSYKAELDELVERYGDSPDEKQLAEIASKKQQRAINVNQAKLQAQQQLKLAEEKIRLKFMDEMRPIAYEVAADYGFSVVLTVPQVYAFRVGSEQDITERVVERVRLKSPSQPDKDLPRLASPIETTDRR